MSTYRSGRSGARKYGRNEAKCQKYRVEHRREKNKIRKLTKLVKKQPNNKQLTKRIRELKMFLKENK